MSDALCECHLPPICECCQREVEKVRGSIWGHTATCSECFLQWYDPDNSSFDHLDPTSIGNYVRKKHGLAATAKARKQS